MADMLMDENHTAQVARPGTSLARPLTSASGSVSSCFVVPKPIVCAGCDISDTTLLVLTLVALNVVRQ